MLKCFRVLSLLEGISYLLILCVSIEIISREFVFTLGITHGVLFVFYLVLSLAVSHKLGWSLVVWLLVFLASIIPFAFLYVEIFLRKQILSSD